MPMREKFFAQPPIELLRQWLDYSGWYDRKERAFKKIIDTTLLAAMGPPGGGRNQITPRIVRHFNVINNTEMDTESMMRIFGTILSGFMSSPPFEEAVSALALPIVTSTVEVRACVCVCVCVCVRV